MMFVVALSLALNLVAGAFSGVLHAHDHEHAAQHQHHHDDGGDNDDDAFAEVGIAGRINVANGGDAGTQSHDHVADINLAPFEALKWAFGRLLYRWSLPPDSALIVNIGYPSERPPRLA